MEAYERMELYLHDIRWMSFKPWQLYRKGRMSSTQYGTSWVPAPVWKFCVRQKPLDPAVDRCMTPFRRQVSLPTLSFLIQGLYRDIHVNMNILIPSDYVYAMFWQKILCFMFIYLFIVFLARQPPVGQGLIHAQRRTTVGRTTLDELAARRRDLYLTTHNNHNRQTSMPPPLGF
jgi:hypothetical protein